ncbi:MAG: TIGR04255 family protein [Desulfomonilaceae bacterium]
MTDSEKLISDSRHPNSPLVEVVFEIRFPGETAIECKRHEIQRKIRSEYPNLLVPPARDGTHLALEPYQFVREDNLAGVMTALNRFSYFSRAYPGFNSFKKECLRLLSIFNEVIKLELLNRVGLRHINIVPFTRENKFLPLKHFFKFTEPLEGFFETQFEQFTNHVVFPSASGTITVHIEVIKTVNSNQEAFLIDIDYAKVDDLKFDDIEDYLDEAHNKSSDRFNSIITSKYFEYIRGKEI